MSEDFAEHSKVLGGEGTSLHTAAIEGRLKAFLNSHDKALTALYEKNLATSTEKEAPIISLETVPPDDREERKEQLQLKIDEYGRRIKRKVIGQGPIININSVLHTLYKRDALKLIIKFGSLNTYAYGRALEEYFGGSIGKREFESACGVADDYVKTGGKNILGGTGLAGKKTK